MVKNITLLFTLLFFTSVQVQAQYASQQALSESKILLDLDPNRSNYRMYYDVFPSDFETFVNCFVDTEGKRNLSQDSDEYINHYQKSFVYVSPYEMYTSLIHLTVDAVYGADAVTFLRRLLIESIQKEPKLFTALLKDMSLKDYQLIHYNTFIFGEDDHGYAYHVQELLGKASLFELMSEEYYSKK